MEKENVFKMLRHLAAKVETDSKHIETCINMPSHMRPGARSAELILKELQCNVQTMTLQAQKDLKQLEEQVSFRNLLENVQIVANLAQERIELLDENLQKYGYEKPDTEVDTKVNNKQASTDQGADKENREPDDEQPAQQPLQTPKQSVTCASVKTQKDNATRTPMLADFGISRETLDFLAKQNMASQRKNRMKTVGHTGTPFKKSSVPTSPVQARETEVESPFDPNVVLTPGLFGYGRKIPTTTPEHMQGSAYMNSPIPPVLQTPGLRQITKNVDDNTVCFSTAVSPNEKSQNRDNSFYATTPFQSRSMISIHPTPTIVNQRNLNPQPKSIWQAESTSDNTPTMPDLQYQALKPNVPDGPKLISIGTDFQSGLPTQSSLHHGNGTPTEPQLMSATEPEKVPQKPVLLSEANSISSKATLPTEPRLLSDQLATKPSSRYNASVGLPVGSVTPFQAFRNFHDTEEMPRTPELTFSYSRFIDVGASLANSKDKSLPSDIPNIEGVKGGLSLNSDPTTVLSSVDVQPVATEVVMHSSNECQKSDGVIAVVSEEEFLQQSSVLQRLLPLNDVNALVKKINKYLARKTEGQFLLESEMSSIGVGPRAKAMLLLLVKLKRLSQARPNAAGDQAYFVI